MAIHSLFLVNKLYLTSIPFVAESPWDIGLKPDQTKASHNPRGKGRLRHSDQTAS